MIIVECNNDELLLRILGVGKKKIKHESGKGDVLRLASKNSPVLAFIDDDPDSEQPKERDNYQIAIQEETLQCCVHFADPEKRLVIISPLLEKWLLIRARKNGIDPKKYGLPEDPKELKSIPHLEKNLKFRQFIEDLARKDSEFQLIASWLQTIQ